MKFVQLSKVAKIQRNSIKPEDIQDGTIYVGLEHINNDGEFDNVGTVENGDLSSSKYKFTENHILYGKLRPYLKKIASPSFDGICSTDILPILTGPELDKRYLFYFLRQQSMIDLATSRSTGANLPRLSPKELAKFEIPLPELGEQRRIAAVLDKADALRQKRRAALARLDTLLQATFLHMFGDPVTNPMGWEVKELEELLVFLTSGSRGWAKYYSDEGSLFLRIQNVRHDELRLDDLTYVNAPDSAENKRTTVQSGDVLLSITADLGRTAVIPKNFPKANINQHLAILRTQGIKPEYLSAFLSSPGGQIQFERLNRQGVKAGLNFDDIKSLEILLPPSSQQIKYLKVKEFIVERQKKLVRQANLFDNLFHALQQRAFSGQL